jgi:hypothetical protein
MSQYLGNIGSPSGASLIINSINNALEKQKQQKLALAMQAIQSGQYQPAPQGTPQPGLMTRIKQNLLGPQVGGPTMNVMGANYQQVTPEMQAQQSANALKMQMKALSDSGMLGANAGSTATTGPIQHSTVGGDLESVPSQMVTKPTIKFNGMKPEVSISQQLNPDYKSYEKQKESKMAVSQIMKSSSGDPSYETAKDLAYGKMTIPFFESMMRGMSGDAMANRLAYYTKAKQINPQFNEAMFENGMFGPKQGLMAIGHMQAITGQAAKNVDAQLNIAEQLSNKINRTQYPILNKVDYLWNTDLKQTPGLSGDIKNFIFSAKLASIDAARVETGQTTGAAVTDSAREHFKDLLQATDSQDTFKKMANFTRVSTQNRMVSLAKERQDMLDQINDMQQNLKGEPIAEEQQYKGADDIDKMSNTSFNSEADVEKAYSKGKVKLGDVVTVNGQKFTVAQ